MGHIPSRTAIQEPFFAELKTAKSGSEILVAVGLTSHNFPSADDPLFQKFVSLVCDPSVRYWFRNAEQPGTASAVVPDLPTATQVFDEYVRGASAFSELNLLPKDWLPIPIVIFRLEKKEVTKPTASNCTCVAYFGVQKFDNDGNPIVEPSKVEALLTPAYQNESRALSIIEIAAKCYQRCSHYRGVRKVPWPREFVYCVPALHLPSLRVMQRLYHLTAPFYQKSAEGNKIDGDFGSLVQLRNGYLTVTIKGPKLAEAAVFLCDRVPQKKGRKPNEPLMHFLKPGALQAVPSNNDLLTVINDTIALAKDRWTEANALVLRQTAIEREDDSSNSARSLSIQSGDALMAAFALEGTPSEVIAPTERSVISARSSAARSGRWTNQPYAPSEAGSERSSLGGSELPDGRQVIPRVPKAVEIPLVEYEHIGSLPVVQLSGTKLRYRNLFLARSTQIYAAVNMVNCTSFLWGDYKTPLRIADYQSGCAYTLALETSNSVVTLINEEFRTIEYELPTNFVWLPPKEWAIIREGNSWCRVQLPGPKEVFGSG